MKDPGKNHDFHNPVMVSEVSDFLETKITAHLNNLIFVDATVGLGGHAKEFVKKGIFVVGIDADKSSLKVAEDVLKKACPTPLDKKNISRGCFKLLHGNFSKIDKLVGDFTQNPIVGVLFDLGISSYQLERTRRGFSFQEINAPLDMRLDKNTQGVKASDLLAVLDKKKLTKVFSEVLPDNLAIKLAQAIVEQREVEPIETVGDFLKVIKPLIRKKGKIDSATLPFLALRMSVNSEIENLKMGLKGALRILSPKGRLAVISFHSGEDRLVKNFFKNCEKDGEGLVITKKPITPGASEIENNPRARSAKMRVLEKL
jgi:16S rRNA (cytosine1402-N4)-methyltransferase